MMIIVKYVDQVQLKERMEIIRNPIHLANTVERRVILHLDVREDLMLSVPSVTNLDMKQ